MPVMTGPRRTPEQLVITNRSGLSPPIIRLKASITGTLWASQGGTPVILTTWDAPAILRVHEGQLQFSHLLSDTRRRQQVLKR